MRKYYLIGIAIITLLLLLIICNRASCSEEIEKFGDWYGIYKNDQKQITTLSKSKKTTLTIYIDKQLITCLKFSPDRKFYLATFDGKSYRNMNYNRFGYGHWIKKMKKYYKLKVWFEHEKGIIKKHVKGCKEKQIEEFSLKGFSKAIRWLYDDGQRKT